MYWILKSDWSEGARYFILIRHIFFAMMIVLKNHEKLQVLKNMMAASAIVYDVEQHQSLNECPMHERHLVEFQF